MRFYLGSHRPHWLAKTDVPLFVSHRTLRDYKHLPVALGPWALDSGGFTELSIFGEWRTTAAKYLQAVERYTDEIGGMDFAAPMDWMCEPWIVAKTGLTVTEHQRRTIRNYIGLRAKAPQLPIIPVLQGWTLTDYYRCVELYERAGVDLAAVPRVGLGSVCRRSQQVVTEQIVWYLAARGVALHGFGVKVAGLQMFGDSLASADSLAWSYRARRSAPLPGCTHKTCANCLAYALQWREKVIRQYETRQHRFALVSAL